MKDKCGKKIRNFQLCGIYYNGYSVNVTEYENCFTLSGFYNNKNVYGINALISKELFEEYFGTQSRLSDTEKVLFGFRYCDDNFHNESMTAGYSSVYDYYLDNNN